MQALLQLARVDRCMTSAMCLTVASLRAEEVSRRADPSAGDVVDVLAYGEQLLGTAAHVL